MKIKFASRQKRILIQGALAVLIVFLNSSCQSSGRANTPSLDAIKVETLPGRFFFIGEDVESLALGKGSIRNIYAMRANSKDITKLAPELDYVSYLAWYPYFKKFGINNITGTKELNGPFLLDVSSISNLHQDSANSNTEESKILQHIEPYPSSAFKTVFSQEDSSFSPDGLSVAGQGLIVHPEYPVLNKTHFCIGQVNGEGVPVCLEETEGCWGNDIAWSPDGKWIVFKDRIKADDTHACNLFELYIVGVNGKGLRQLTNIPGREMSERAREALTPLWEKERYYHKTGYPSFSPDGNWILFQSTQGIGKIHPDGSGLQIIVKDGFSPTWSPDGKMIAYIVARRDEHAKKVSRPFTFLTSIFVSWADGSGAVELTKNRSSSLSITHLNWAN